MSEVGTSYLLTQLGYHGPALLVYLVAFILSLVYMGRASMPCILTLVGVGILVITTLGVAVVQAWLLDARQADLMRDVGLAGSCIRAIGLGLLVTAIFVGRRSGVGGGAELGAAPDRGRM